MKHSIWEHSTASSPLLFPLCTSFPPPPPLAAPPPPLPIQPSNKVAVNWKGLKRILVQEDNKFLLWLQMCWNLINGAGLLEASEATVYEAGVRKENLSLLSSEKTVICKMRHRGWGAKLMGACVPARACVWTVLAPGFCQERVSAQDYFFRVRLKHSRTSKPPLRGAFTDWKIRSPKTPTTHGPMLLHQPC